MIVDNHFSGRFDQDTMREGIRALSTWTMHLRLWAAEILVVALFALAFDFPIGLFALTALIAIVVTYLVRELRLRTAIQSVREASISGHYTDHYLASDWPDSRTIYSWSAFTNVKSNRQAATFVLRNSHVRVISRDWFTSDEAWNRFLARATAEVGRPHAPPPALDEVFSDGLDGSPTTESVKFAGGVPFPDLLLTMSKLNPLRRVGWFLIATVGLIVVLGVAGVPGMVMLTLLIGPAALLLAFAVLVLVPLRTTHMMSRGIMAQGTTGHISSHGLGQRGSDVERMIEWSAVRRAADTGRCVALYVDPSLPVVVFRRWFDHEADWKRCVELVQRNVPA